MDFSLSHWKHPSVSASRPGSSTPNMPIAMQAAMGGRVYATRFWQANY